MNQKEFRAAVQIADKATVGYCDFRGLETVWAKEQHKRLFTDSDVAAFISWRTALDTARLSRGTTKVYDSNAGDGFGLWKEVSN